MPEENDLASAIRQLSDKNEEIYAKVCEVLSFDQLERTVDVKPIDASAEIFGVRLQADSDNGGLVLAPKIGSFVLVVFLNKNAALVVNTSELDYYDLIIDKVNFKVDKDGFLLRKENETLKKLMADLIAAIKKMSFTTNVGPTINLINIAEFEAVEKRFNKFLK
jgi:hypothetical protein